jgi:hypothetical protein
MKPEGRLDGPWEYGKWKAKRSGKRTDIEDLRKALEEGRDDKYIADNHFGSFLRYQRGIGAWRKLHKKVRKVRTGLAVIIGQSGVGKTLMVQRLYPNAWWKDQTKWWDSYQGQSVIVLDEFMGWTMVGQLNRMCGTSTPYDVEVKGGMEPFLAKKVIVISNVGIDSWWNWDNIRIPKESVLRRIDELCVWTKHGGQQWYYGDAIRLHINAL